MELSLEISGDQIAGARDYQEDAFLTTYLDDESGDSKSSALIVVADGSVWYITAYEGAHDTKGRAGALDLVKTLSNWGGDAESGADVDRDGDADLEDVIHLFRAFGSPEASSGR